MKCYKKYFTYLYGDNSDVSKNRTEIPAINVHIAKEKRKKRMILINVLISLINGKAACVDNATGIIQMWFVHGVEEQFFKCRCESCSCT